MIGLKRSENLVFLSSGGHGTTPLPSEQSLRDTLTSELEFSELRRLLFFAFYFVLLLCGGAGGAAGGGGGGGASVSVAAA